MAEASLSTVDFLSGVSRWFAAREAGDGSMTCPRHQIEHTGKAVYAAAIDLALRKATGDSKYEARIRNRVLRTLTMLKRDAKTGASVFFPGSLDHRNAATNLIDSGACCDVLAEVADEARDLFTAAERERICAAVTAVCDTYLMKAVIQKEVPAQRLWGATGLARAARTFGRQDWGEQAVASIRRMIEQANADGSTRYMPEPERHGEHAGLADISSFYHSRHAGFAAYVYRCLGVAPERDVAAFLKRALDFLVALYGKDGIKPLANEAKQWYWESRYEVASHSFDVHALLEGERLFAEPYYRYLARLSLQRLVEHVEPDGGVVSHRGPEINFQCRDFWNGHVAWIARVLDRVPAEPVPEPPPRGIEVFEESGLVRVERRDYCALLRGRKQPINISFGGDAGGGSLLWFGRRERGFADDLCLPKWSSQTPGNFVVTPRERPSFRQRALAFYRDNRHDMRFRLYVANIERKAGNVRTALGYPMRHVIEKLRDELKGRYASQFDLAPSLARNAGELSFSAMLARRDGTVLKGSQVTRRFVCGDLELEIEDTLVLDLPVRAVLYTRIPASRDFEVESEAPYKSNGATLMFHPRSFPVLIRVRYRL